MPATFDFTPPPYTVKTVFTLESEAGESSAGFANAAVKPGMLVRKMPQHYWKGCWIWDAAPVMADVHLYLRHAFTVDDPAAVEEARFQWLTDEISELFLNGKYIGKVTSWARPTLSGNIKRYLRKGTNIIAARAYNQAGAAAFLCELTINYGDRSDYVCSDIDWKVSSTAPDGWDLPGFDDTSWQQATCKVLIPRNPYGLVPYTYFGRRQKAEIIRLASPLRVHGEKKSDITIMIKSEGNFAAEKEATVALYRGNYMVASEKSLLKQRQPGLLCLSTAFSFPSDADKGTYTVKVDSPVLEFRDGNVAGTIEYSPSPAGSERMVAVIKPVNGVPRLLINGKPTSFVTYRLGIDGRGDHTAYLNDFYNAGVRIIELAIPLDRVWKSQDRIDYDMVDSILDEVLFVVPKSRLIISFSIYAPGWWKHLHKEEMTAFEDGVWPQVSYASSLFLNDSERALGSIIKHIENRQCANRIIGYYLSGGEDGQWMLWVEGGSGAMVTRDKKRISDYSKPMQEYFRNWLQRKYGDIGKLNCAWGANIADFRSVMLPGASIRKSVDGGFFYDPKKQMNVIDFQQALSDSITDAILRYSGLIKRLTENRKTVGVYYGKIFTIGGHNEWAEFGFNRLLHSREIDYFSGPSYFQRQPGRPHSSSAPLASIALHDKMYVDEADLRTYAGGAGSWAYTGNPWDTVNTIRKIFALNAVENQAVRWFDIHPGEFADSVIMHAVADMSRIATKTVKWPAKHAEVAVIVSEQSLTYTSMEANDYMQRAVRNQWAGMFYRIGAPVDFYMLDDLRHSDFPEYKMYIFLNAWSIDAGLKSALQRLQKNGSVFVWFHAPGIISDEGLNVDNVDDVTGIGIKRLIDTVVKVQYSPQSDIPFLSQIKPVVSSLSGINALYYPVGGKAVTFGCLGSHASGAFRDLGSWKSIYFSAPVMTPELLREIAKYAGCHIYSQDSDDMIYAGSGMIGIHTAAKGLKKINLPVQCLLKDLISGEIINIKKSNGVEFPMDAGETRLFELVP
ncbi:MAG: beta-galactosidase [bacterium]|nr:beta-galactosidase [bacterium]